MSQYMRLYMLMAYTPFNFVLQYLYHNTLSNLCMFVCLFVCLFVISLVNKQIHVALPCKYLINWRHKYLIN